MLPKTLPTSRLGLSFSDLRTTWNQYAPTIRTDLKAIRDEFASEKTVAPAGTILPAPRAPVAPGPAPSSKGPLLAALLGIGLVAGGGYYLYRKGFFRIKK